MKKSQLLFCAAISLLVASCGQKKKEVVEERVVETTDSITGISSLRELHVTDSVTVQGATYTYSYDLVASDSLPIVRNIQGYDYRDNTVSLTVKRGGSVVYSHRFTKNDFSSLIPEDYMPTSALVGFTYNYTKLDDHSALYFIAAVGDPDEAADLTFPIQVKIATDGTMSMEKATNLETAPISEGMTVDPNEDNGV